MSTFARPVVHALVTTVVLACRTVPNESPPPIPVPRSLAQADVELAVLLAIADQPVPPNLTPGQQIADNALSAIIGPGYESVSRPRQYWYFEDRDAGVVFAGFQHRSHYMRVAVRYDTNSVTIQILESRNLRQSGTRIHKNALVWLQSLENRLRRTLGQMAHRYEVQPAEVTRPAPKLPRDTSIYVTIPEDGRFTAQPYVGSGTLTTQEVVSALSLYTSHVSSARSVAPFEENMAAARSASARYLLQPTILHWEERATEWSGKSDRVSVRLDLFEVATGATIDSTVILGKSRWATFGGDHPQELLPEPLSRYVSTLFAR